MESYVGEVEPNLVLDQSSSLELYRAYVMNCYIAY